MLVVGRAEDECGYEGAVRMCIWKMGRRRLGFIPFAF